MRAASTACTVSGIGSVASGSPSTQAPSDSTRAPLSTSSPTSSSRKNGLPPARSTTRSRRSSGRPPRASRRACATAASDGSGPSQSTVAFRFAGAPRRPLVEHAPGERSRATTSGARASETSARGDRADRARPSGCPRPGAPSGSPRAISSTNAHRCGVQPLPRVERVELGRDVEPEREPEDLASLEAPLELLGGCALTQREVLAHDLAERPVGDPVAVRETAAGSNRSAPAPRSRGRPRSSRTSRDFPTPGSPTSVTRCGSAPAAARR